MTRPAPDTASAVQASRWVDTGYFLRNFGTDPEACAELVALFVRVSAVQMEALAAAQTAADWGRVSREAHALKGSLGLFGARSTIQLLDSIEAACRVPDPGRIGQFLAVLVQSMACISVEVSALHPARNAG